jgi:uncharacterized membrane protein YfcA
MTSTDAGSVLSMLMAGLSGGQILFVVASAFVAGLARGFSGFGAALIFMPLASAVVEPRVAAPLLLIVDAVAAVPLIPDAWRRAHRREVGTMVLGALAGVPLGTAVLAFADPQLVRWGIAAAVSALLALLASGWRYRGRPSGLVAAGVGALSGLFAGAAQIGGPPVVAYWLGRGSTGASVRADIVLYFAASTVLTGAGYLIGGLITPRVVVLAIAVGPSYAAGLALGSRLFRRAGEVAFRRTCFGLIAGAAILGLPLLDPILR